MCVIRYTRFAVRNQTCLETYLVLDSTNCSLSLSQTVGLIIYHNKTTGFGYVSVKSLVCLFQLLMT